MDILVNNSFSGAQTSSIPDYGDNCSSYSSVSDSNSLIEQNSNHSVGFSTTHSNIMAHTVSETTSTGSLAEENVNDLTTYSNTAQEIHSNIEALNNFTVNSILTSTVHDTTIYSNSSEVNIQSTDTTDLKFYEYEWEEILNAPGQVFVGIAVAIFCVLTVGGNILTITAFVKDVKLRTVQSMYIFNLAVTDLLIGLSSIPFYGSYTVSHYTWHFGYSFCKMWSVIDYWVCAESSLTIILISYDRLQMVLKGAQYATLQTKPLALLKISFSWALSFLIYSPAIIGYNHWRGYSTIEPEDCDTEFADEFTYVTATAFLEFCIPFVLLVSFNSMLYWNIRKRSLKEMGGAANKARLSISTIQRKISTALNPNELKKVTEKKALRKDIKAAKSLAILVITYAICWSPYTIVTIFMSFFPDTISDNAYEPTVWLLWLNSALNPMLYAVTNQRFRDNFRVILCKVNFLHLGRKDKVHPVMNTTQTDISMNS